MHSFKNLILFLFCLLLNSVLFAQQEKSIKGKVQVMPTNAKTAEAVPSASIVVVTQNDSSFVTGGTSDLNGNFNICFPFQKEKQYLLRVSYIGYTTAFCSINDSTSVFNAGNILLKNKGIELGEVTVTAKEPDIRMIGDTTIINASVYKTPEGAYLQDLVRRIPGLEYDEQSKSLTYNGLPIHEINVNGEAFFSGNIGIPLENLPAAFIGSLKVYDKLTETELATGMDDGKERYVLDLQTKTKFNKTYFASAQAGYGNNHKKENEAQFNYFRKGGDNFSFLLNSGNKNQNSTYSDNISNSAAMNMSHKFGNKVSLTGNMQYSHNRNGNISNYYREQYLTTTNQYSSSSSEGTQENRMFFSNWKLSWNLNKRTHLNFSTRLGLNKNNNQSDNENATFNVSPELDIKNPFSGFDSVADSIKINHSTSLSDNSSRSSSYGLNANLVKTLNEKGTNISFSLQNNGKWSKKNNLSESTTSYFQIKNVSGNDSVLYRNQLKRSPAHADNFDIGTAFTHPLCKKVRLQLSYMYSVKNEKNNSDSYDLTSGVELYIDSLENRSNSKFQTHNLGMLFNYSNKIWKINAGISVTSGHRKIERKVGELRADTSIKVTDWTPMLRMIWRNKKRYRVSFSYKGNTRHPSLSQLVPLTDNSNPLKITIGNPNLKDAFSHSLRIDMQNSRKGIFVSGNWRAEQNSITQVTTYNEQTGGSETYPENINGNWRMNIKGRWQKKLGKIRIMLNTSGDYANQVSLLSEDDTTVPQRCVTRNMGINNRLRLSFQPNWGTININAANRFRHSLNTLKNNSSYTRNYNFKMDAYADLPGSIQFRTDIAYSFRNGTNLQNNDNSEIMWNMGFLWRFLSKKQTELSLYWSDILNERKAYERNTDSNSFYESYTRQIQGYVMVSLKYNFRLMK